MSESVFIKGDCCISDNRTELHKPTIEQMQVNKETRTMVDVSRANYPNKWVDISWLKSAAPIYQISANIGDYVIVPIPIVTSNIPNRNMQAFTVEELVSFNAKMGRMVYQTFIGRPLHVEHCFEGNTLVLTNSGHKPIKSITRSDFVMTHTGYFRKVTKKFVNKDKKLTEIRAQGALSIYATENHPMFVVDKRQIFGKIGNSGGASWRHRKDDIEWDDLTPHFRPVSDVYVGDYLVIPITIGGNIKVDKDFAFLTGVYAAEGSFNWHTDVNGIRYPVSTILTIGYHEKDYKQKIVKCLANLKLPYSINDRKKKGVININVRDRKFSEKMLDLIGVYSHRKRLNGEIRNWDNISLKWFLGGYASGDGCTTNGKKVDGEYAVSRCTRLRCVTTSINLAYDIQQLLARLGIPATIGRRDSGTMTVNGKEYKTRVAYIIGSSANHAHELNPYTIGKKDLIFNLTRESGVRILVKDEYILAPILMINRDSKTGTVYNLEVEEDHTYIANSFLVHNCNTDPTKARGAILDATLQPVKKYGVLKVNILAAFDRTKDTNLVGTILKESKTGYSMGALAGGFICSVCNGMLGPSIQRTCTCYDTDYTNLRSLGKIVRGKLHYHNAIGVNFVECSAVLNPADQTSWSYDKL